MLKCKKISYENGMSNSYLIWDEEHSEAMVVDCGILPDPVFSLAENNGLKVKYIILTHMHYDHVVFLDQFRRIFPEAEVCIGAADAPLLSDVEANVSYLFGDTRAFLNADHLLYDGDLLHLGSRQIRVLTTPGHTPGSLCLYADDEKFMITGDTIFGGGGIGRTDFKYGSISELRASLKRILSMDGDIIIMPGHGGTSKIAYEQRSLFY